jgi:glucosamine-6-phosphate deaminase
VAECQRYAALLNEAPIDLVCLGVGENGHIAFNDPPVADFNDPLTVKVVELDLACRQQQVNDGCFPNIDLVPRQAITLTCPILLSGRTLVCVVPGPRKAAAVKNVLCGPVGTACPATVLRRHASATLHLDVNSAGLLSPSP